MSDKFVPLETVIEADWLNQVDDHLNTPHSSATDHSLLTHRSDPDSHPIVAITGLQEALASNTGGNGNIISVVSNISELQATVPVTNKVIYLAGRESFNDSEINGPFTWDSNDVSNLVNKDPHHGIVVPLTGQTPPGITGGHIRRYPKGMIRPEWFGTNYTHLELQRAAAYLNEGDSIIITPGSVWNLAEPITLLPNKVKIGCESGQTEGLPIFKALVNNLTLLNAFGYGQLIHGIAFQGTDAELAASTTTYGSCVGINNDLSSVSSDWQGANSDITIINCGFAILETGIYCKGRNFDINHNMFSHNRYGIHAEVYTYGTNGRAQFRGLTIENNRFHVNGAPKVYKIPELQDLETVCIKTPIDLRLDDNGDVLVSQIRVLDNYADYSADFYKGSLCRASINDNTVIQGCGTFIKSEIPDGQLQNGNMPSIITNNNYDAGSSSYYQNGEFGIFITNTADVNIVGNNLFSARRNAIYLKNPRRFNISNNEICNANWNYAVDGDYAAIHLDSTLDYSMGYNSGLSTNIIRGGQYSYGIYINGRDEYYTLVFNNIEKGRLGIYGSSQNNPSLALPANIYFEQNDNNPTDFGDLIIRPWTYYEKPGGRKVQFQCGADIHETVNIGNPTSKTAQLTVKGPINQPTANIVSFTDNGEVPIFTVRNDGAYAFKGGTLGPAVAFDISGVTNQADYTLSSTDSTFGSIVSFLGTLVKELKLKGIIK